MVTKGKKIEVALAQQKCHFGDESFPAIDCTDTGNRKQWNKTPHTPETQNRNRKNCPS